VHGVLLDLQAPELHHGDDVMSSLVAPASNALNDTVGRG
jgi:hypothetical protein